MGIPFYFKSLISRFPDIVKRPMHKCTRLYLDYNCIIHTEAAKLLHAPPYTNVNVTPEVQQRFYDHVISASLDYISFITKYVQPTELLYIAVDGMCPRAKMQQQRKRRFMSQWRTEQVNRLKKTSGPSLWDSNIVTPGTEFMEKFDRALDRYVEHMTVSNKIPYRVECSGSKHIGEGEHKIFDHMTLVSASAESLDVVYGLDADLIMLSMIQKTSGSIALLREVPEFKVSSTQDFRAPFLMLDIPLLRSTLIRECLQDDPERLNDYVLLCVLIGNDFVPPLSYLKIKNDGIDLVLSVYKRLIADTYRLNTYIVWFDEETSENKLDLQLFSDLIKELASVEDEHMCAAEASYYNRKSYQDHKSTAESRVDNYPGTFKYPKVINATQQNWRLNYYKHLFHYEGKDLVQKACSRYLEGIMWVFNYYFVKHHNLGWYYPFNYSPTCLDLYNFMVTEDEKIITYTRTTSDSDESHGRFLDMAKERGMQLLLVLPPHSIALLPTQLQAIMKSVEVGCVQFYPVKFDITLYLKTYLWECCAIIPDIDIDRVYRAYKHVVSSVSQVSQTI